MDEFLNALIIRLLATVVFSALFTYLAYRYLTRVLIWFTRVLTEPKLALQVLVVYGVLASWLLINGSLAPIPNYVAWAYILGLLITGFLTCLEGAIGSIIILRSLEL